MISLLRLLILLALLAGSAAPARAADALGAREVLQRALLISPTLRAEREALRALSGRRVAAGTLLPSHPALTVSLAQRRPAEAGAPVLNWYVTLSQEVEIAGQRGARVAAADAELAAQVRRVAVAAQEAAAAALGAYYEVLAAQEERAIAEELAAVGEGLSRLAAGRAQQALLSPVDAAVAEAEASRLKLWRVSAVQRVAASRALLASLLDQPLGGGPPLRGALQEEPGPPPELPPLDGDLAVLLRRALTLRGELAAAEQERALQQQHLRLLRRARAPNLTLSAFAQSDGFHEMVLGGGVSLPVPLPSPLGPSRRGEIDEARARVEQAAAERDRVRRRVEQEVARAYHNARAQEEALRLIPAPQVRKARAALLAIGKAVGGRLLPLREALLSQRSLIELISAQLKIRHELALARVELARATGLLVPGVQP